MAFKEDIKVNGDGDKELKKHSGAVLDDGPRDPDAYLDAMWDRIHKAKGAGVEDVQLEEPEKDDDGEER